MLAGYPFPLLYSWSGRIYICVKVTLKMDFYAAHIVSSVQYYKWSLYWKVKDFSLSVPLVTKELVPLP